MKQFNCIIRVHLKFVRNKDKLSIKQGQNTNRLRDKETNNQVNIQTNEEPKDRKTDIQIESRRGG